MFEQRRTGSGRKGKARLLRSLTNRCERVSASTAAAAVVAAAAPDTRTAAAATGRRIAPGPVAPFPAQRRRQDAIRGHALGHALGHRRLQRLWSPVEREVRASGPGCRSRKKLQIKLRENAASKIQSI